MARSCRSLAPALALAALLPAASAWADESTGVYSKDEWPLRAVDRPLNLAPSMVEIRGDTLGVSLVADNAFKPIFFAPDIYFGVNSKLTVGLVTLGGFCLSGTDGNCPKSFNDIGLEAIYGLARAGNIQLAAHAGVIVPSFDPAIAGVDVGLRLRIVGGPVALQFDPSCYIGAVGRDEVYATFSPTLGPEEYIHVPIDIQYQINAQAMAFLSGGVEGPSDGFGDTYRIPLGLGILYALNNRFDVGAEFRLLDAFGKTEDKLDYRFFFLRAALRL
jgi:hypothetical protein